MIATAKRKNRENIPGRCYGIDIFDTSDQSGNSPRATVANVLAADVGDRCVLHTASFTELPFPDETFTLVTSSLACESMEVHLCIF